ncbi:MAG: glycosyltransferase 87 family protein [Bacteroidales bacterium]|jgi:hypothetical protein
MIRNDRRFLALQDKPLIGFGLFVLVICLANIILNNVNHRFWLTDFNVYYAAAKNLTNGSAVYLQAFGDGSGYYKYSPVILCFFMPYLALNYYVASVIHFTILSAAFFYAFVLIYRMLTRYFFQEPVKRAGQLLSIAFTGMVIHLVRELYLGNINILLLCLCLVALRHYLKGKTVSGSILFGIVLLTKPFYLLLILPLLFRKRIKAIAVIALTILVGLLLPFALFGIDRTLSLYSGWMKIMEVHTAVFPGKNTLEYLVGYYFIPDLPWYTDMIIIFVVAVIFSVFNWFNLKLEKSRTLPGKSGDQDFIFEWWILLALIPNLVKTDSEHFLSTAPLLAFLVFFIALRKKYWLIPVMVILIFFYGANSKDLLGSTLSERLFSMGLFGLSNLILVILSFVSFLDFRTKQASSL